MNYYDEEPILKPSSLIKKARSCPETAVIVWQNGFEKAAEKYIVSKETSIITGVSTTVYKVCYEGLEMLYMQIPMGAPVVAAFIEELAVYGVKHFVFSGCCGVIDKNIKERIVIPDKTLIDEGVSCHYLKDFSELNDVFTLKVTESVFKELQIPYDVTGTWTTDALYRETPSAMKYAVSKGCGVVDMECSAIMTVCKYLKLDACQFFFTADSLHSGKWDKGSLRNLPDNAFEFYLNIAFKIGLKLSGKAL